MPNKPKKGLKELITWFNTTKPVPNREFIVKGIRTLAQYREIEYSLPILLSGKSVTTISTDVANFYKEWELDVIETRIGWRIKEKPIAITNSKQLETLEKVFKLPTPNNILWTDIISLLKHVGCTIEYRGGSEVKATKGTKKMFEHRPHPSNQTPCRTVKTIRTFLTRIGVTP